jgi:hypothetical protein
MKTKAYNVSIESLTEDTQYLIGGSTDRRIAEAMGTGSLNTLLSIGNYGWAYRVRDTDGETVSFRTLSIDGRILPA